MTYTQYVNCDKWKKVIGITLWVGACIGLGVLLNGAIHIYGTQQYGLYVCGSHFVVGNGTGWGSIVESCGADYQTETFILVAISAMNIANYFMIWRTLNNHYRWLEIKCGVKPKTEKVE